MARPKNPSPIDRSTNGVTNGTVVRGLDRWTKGIVIAGAGPRRTGLGRGGRVAVAMYNEKAAKKPLMLVSVRLSRLLNLQVPGLVRVYKGVDCAR